MSMTFPPQLENSVSNAGSTDDLEGQALNRVPAPLFFARIPIPPSVNKMYVYVSAKRRVRSKEYETWIARAGRHMQAAIERRHGQDPIDCKFFSVLSCQRPNLMRDLDNWTKATFDLLQKHKVIKNDNLQVGMLPLWSPKKKGDPEMLTLCIFDAANVPLLQFQMVDEQAGVGICKFHPPAN